MGKKNECYLCGAKLHQGYCKDCGLDNTKIRRKNYRLNESGTVTKVEYKKVEADPPKKETSYQFVPQNKVLQNRTPRTPKTKAVRIHKKPISRGKGLVKLIVIVNILLIVGSTLFELYQENHSYQTGYTESIFGGSYEIETNEEYDPYEYVFRKLASTGDELTLVLGAGEYVVGTHIPEGNYTIILQEGSGYFSLNDDENSIYIGESFGENKEYDEVSERQDVRLYQNAQFSISEGVVLEFSTDCAQSQSMTYIENPLTEQILVEQDETRIVGTDIPAGIYNVICQEGSVWLTYSIPANPEWYDEDYIENGLWLDSKYGSESYSNLVLPEGTKISAEGGELLLVPSEWIASEDYGAHYPYYFY